MAKHKKLKVWNVRLKVSEEEEKKIKMQAIQEGMMISEYIKETLLDRLSNITVTVQSNSK